MISLAIIQRKKTSCSWEPAAKGSRARVFTNFARPAVCRGLGRKLKKPRSPYDRWSPNSLKSYLFPVSSFHCSGHPFWPTKFRLLARFCFYTVESDHALILKARKRQKIGHKLHSGMNFGVGSRSNSFPVLTPLPLPISTGSEAPV